MLFSQCPIRLSIRGKANATLCRDAGVPIAGFAENTIDRPGGGRGAAVPLLQSLEQLFSGGVVRFRDGLIDRPANAGAESTRAPGVGQNLVGDCDLDR
jgi:hypothetical protein